MATRKPSEIRAGLKRKGFREEPGARHFKLVLQRDGKDTHIFTIVSHGHNEYGDGLLGLMSRQQLRLSKADLLRLIDCSMSEADYVAHLAEIGVLHG